MAIPLKNFTKNSLKFTFRLSSGTYIIPDPPDSWLSANMGMIIAVSIIGGLTIFLIIATMTAVKRRRSRAVKPPKMLHGH